MLPIILVALLAVPLLELYVIVKVAGEIGFLETVALLILISVVGAWLLRQQGWATWRRLNESLARGEVPTREAVDGALILFGGALLLTPGFLTDVMGLFLLFPPTRSALKSVAARSFARRAGRVYEARVVSVRRDGRVSPSLEEPESTRRPDEGDSPDTG